MIRPHLLWVIFAKESLDNLRDRRSLFLALVYPFIGALLLGLLVSMVGGMLKGQGEQRLFLSVLGADNAPDLMAFLNANGVNVLPPPGDPYDAVRSGRDDAVLIVPRHFPDRLREARTADVEIVINATRLSTVITVSRVAELLRKYSGAIADERLTAKGVDPEAATPVRINTVNVGQARNLAGFFLNMLPPFIIFTIFVGGVYMAIDTTAGERERGSIEPLLTNPVARGELMSGKAAATLLFTMIAVSIQLLAFKGMFEIVSSERYGVNVNPGWMQFVGIFLVCIPLMMFAVALQVIVATVSRSIKETQTYLGLLPLIPSLPGMVLVFVPLKAKLWMAGIPTFGQILIMGRLVREEPLIWSHVAVSAVSTTAIALLLFCAAARLYERDSLVFSH